MDKVIYNPIGTLIKLGVGTRLRRQNYTGDIGICRIGHSTLMLLHLESLDRINNNTVTVQNTEWLTKKEFLALTDNKEDLYSLAIEEIDDK